MSAIETWQRHTIMDGKVVEFALWFSGSGAFPEGKEAGGPFLISASRNCVMVHRADVRTPEELAAVGEALHLAFRKHRELAAAAAGINYFSPVGPAQPKTNKRKDD